ncbi:hypothetical protein BSF33_13415 [Staphylococcus ureilyticus]|nr:hypothetical protein BSF33_13415 [Staphylococcus ureilyticus]
MFLKNKFYRFSIIFLFVIDAFLVVNEDIISSPLGERIFYIVTILIFVLILVGLIQKRRY